MHAALMPGRGMVEVSGPEAREFLQGLVSNDVGAVGADRSVHAALLGPQGKVLFDFLVIGHGDAFLLDCERARAGDLVKRLALYRLRAKVEIADVSAAWQVAALWGGEAAAALNLADRPGATRAHHGGVALIDPRLAALGARLVLPQADTAGILDRPGLTPATIADYTDHRFALGIGEGSAELGVEAMFLLETNAEPLHGVDFRKGCYVGQELTARMKHRATLRKRLMPARFVGPAPAPGAPVTAGTTAVGAIRAVHRDRALTLLRLDNLAACRAAGTPLVAEGAQLTVETPSWLAAAIGDDAAVPTDASA